MQKLSTALPSLKEQGIEQLYPSSTPPPNATNPERNEPSESPRPVNHAYYLLKISKSLLLNFLEFVGVLAVSPEQFQLKIDNLRNLFINAHHLLNLYRPHQARESLIMMMEEQLDRTREEIRQMDRVKADVERVLERLAAEDIKGSTDEQQPREATHVDDSIDESRLMWSLLEKDE